MADDTNDIAAAIYMLRTVGDELKASCVRIEGTIQRLETACMTGLMDSLQPPKSRQKQEWSLVWWMLGCAGMWGLGLSVGLWWR